MKTNRFKPSREADFRSCLAVRLIDLVKEVYQAIKYGQRRKEQTDWFGAGKVSGNGEGEMGRLGGEARRYSSCIVADGGAGSAVLFVPATGAESTGPSAVEAGAEGALGRCAFVVYCAQCCMNGGS